MVVGAATRMMNDLTHCSLNTENMTLLRMEEMQATVTAMVGKVKAEVTGTIDNHDDLRRRPCEDDEVLEGNEKRQSILIKIRFRNFITERSMRRQRRDGHGECDSREKGRRVIKTMTLRGREE